MRRVGLFGGTFDPVHLGHIELAEYALESCELDKVMFLPAAAPPHKFESVITSFQHRVQMIRLAIGADKRFSVSEIETHLTPPTYTIDTLKVLKASMPAGGELFFIIGSDAFLEIEYWKDHYSVLSQVHFIVVARSGDDSMQLLRSLSRLGYEKKDGYWYNGNTSKKIYFLDIDVAAISSSEIRAELRRGRSVDDMLDPAVKEYIQRHKLYTSKEGRL